MTTITWQFIINALAILVSLYVLFFKTYFQEKGKNVATKEDIEEITQKVELVKSEIGLLAQKKIGYHSERYSAMIECHGEYYKWINVILNTNIIVVGDFDKADKFRNQAKKTVENALQQFLGAEAKFDIYFVGSDLLAVEGELRAKTIELSNFLDQWLIKGHTVTKQLAVVDALPDSDYKTQRMSELYAERLQTVNEYYRQRQFLYSPIAVLTGGFTKMINAEVVKL